MINHADRQPNIRSVVMITSIAYSLSNFRGPLIQAMVADGIRVFAMAPDHDEKTRDALRTLGAEPVDIAMDRAGVRPFHDLIDAIRLFRILRRLKPDLAFCYFIKPVIYGSLAAKLARVPYRYALVAGLGYVYTVDPDHETIRRKFLRRAVSTMYRVAFAACQRVFFQNKEDIAELVSSRVIPVEKAVELSGSGVDLRRLRLQPPVESPPTFLLMARLLREKGICEYADAARLILKEHPNVKFLLLGGFDPNPSCLSRGEIEQWVKEGLIEWHGHVDDVRPWIARSSVYVLPSTYREGKPRSTQEAMAMGRPVITTNAPGCRDTVIDGLNGFQVPIRDVPALAAAMRRFIEDPTLIAKMGAESRRLAEEMFDVTKINAIIMNEMGLSVAGHVSSGKVLLGPSERAPMERA